MRPVLRGDTPTDEEGRAIEYGDYKDARDDLIDRMGDYCSYCEVALHSQVDVEHVQPKSLNPELELEWKNFLLACGNCNSINGNNRCNVSFRVGAETWLRGAESGVYPVGNLPQAGFWNSIRGFPIICREGAGQSGRFVAPWLLPKHPCLSAAIEAFLRGWRILR